jgi:pimeloyl-ACP methyl ester carboxylesterase
MLATLFFLSALVVERAAPPPKFEPRTCTADDAMPTARCGIVRVAEDRFNPDRRSIELNIVILPSRGAARLPPLFDIDGGPGLNATKNAGFYASNPVSSGRDVVMIDQRGTGQSNPLRCPGLEALGPNQPMLPRPLVDECRKALGSRADLRFYGTLDAVHDIDDVRRALGHERIDLFGMSYGTTVALRYMDHFPDKVRAAVLMGTSPPTAMPPQHHATAGTRALQLLLADCRRDDACNRRFPNLSEQLATARSWLQSGEGPIQEDLFMERLRTMFYTPASRAGVPLTIERASRRDLRELLASKPASGPPTAEGMFLAVTCGEGISMMDFDRAARAARSSMMGDYRLRRQRAACDGWPVVRFAPDHSSLPTGFGGSLLLISGDWDPVTPPEWAEQVRRSIKRARHVVVPAGGHVPDGMSGMETCLDPLMIGFLDHGDPARLDTSCVAAMKPPAYRLN